MSAHFFIPFLSYLIKWNYQYFFRKLIFKRSIIPSSDKSFCGQEASSPPLLKSINLRKTSPCSWVFKIFVLQLYSSTNSFVRNQWDTKYLFHFEWNYCTLYSECSIDFFLFSIIFLCYSDNPNIKLSKIIKSWMEQYMCAIFRCIFVFTSFH